MRDPYEVLGVKKNADAAAIKGAYRKLAKKLHPDANKDDPKAAQRFAELNSAYEILSAEDKRQAYDRGEIDAEGKPKFQGFEGFGPGAGFGRGGARGGPGDFSFESFSFGPEGVRRSSGGPGGTGHAPDLEELLSGMFGGAQRGGRGRRGGFAPEEEPSGQDVTAEVTISLTESAKGTTRRVQLPTGKELDVKIPAGLGDGKQIRLKGQGLPGYGGGAGDVLITVHVAPHPYFKLDGNDLRIEVPIALYEAVLGGKVRVPTLGGAVELNIPAGTSSGRTFRLGGKGMPSAGKAGDLYATVRIALPDKEDRELEDLMRKWKHERPYDPRKDLK
jgi:DnaJ-class molecular chaperone